MINLVNQEERFKNHVAKFTDYGNIKILDFQEPGRIDYRIRFLFEEDFYRLHISGDLGELIACNYDNMTYEGMKDFLNNPYYFEEKISCHNRRLYTYDVEKAKEELKKEFEEEDSFDDDNYCDTWEEAVECKIREILWDFNDNSGLGPEGYETLDKMNLDAASFTDLGKERTGIIELYLLAFRLAQKDLKRQETEVQHDNV